MNEGLLRSLAPAEFFAVERVLPPFVCSVFVAYEKIFEGASPMKVDSKQLTIAR